MIKRSALPDHIEPGFNRAAKNKKKRPSPVSIRFSDAQRAALESHTNGQALGPYIKDYVLRGHNAQVRPKNRNPIKNHDALARLLRGLGQSELRTYLCALYELASEGQFTADAETTDKLKQACTDVIAMRSDLVAALGLREGCGE